MRRRSINKLILTNLLSIFEKESRLIIDGEEAIKNTIYLFDRTSEEYVQIYSNGESLEIYKIYKEIPNNKYQFTDYTMASIQYL